MWQDGRQISQRSRRQASGTDTAVMAVRCGVTACLLLAATASLAEAQRASSFMQLPLLVGPGDTVTVTDRTGRELKGKIAALSPSTLALLADGIRHDLTDADVAFIRQRRPDSPGRRRQTGLHRRGAHRGRRGLGLGRRPFHSGRSARARHHGSGGRRRRGRDDLDPQDHLRRATSNSSPGGVAVVLARASRRLALGGVLVSCAGVAAASAGARHSRGRVTVVPVTSRDGMFRSVRIGVGANVGELSEHARHIGESLCG